MSTALSPVTALLFLLFTAVLPCFVANEPGSRTADSGLGRSWGVHSVPRQQGEKVKWFVRRRRVFVVSLTALPPATAIKAAPTKPIRFRHRKPHRATCGLLPPGAETCPCVSELLMADQKEQRALRHANTPSQPPDVSPPSKASASPLHSCPLPECDRSKGNLVLGSPTQSHLEYQLPAPASSVLCLVRAEGRSP